MAAALAVAVVVMMVLARVVALVGQGCSGSSSRGICISVPVTECALASLLVTGCWFSRVRLDF